MGTTLRPSRSDPVAIGPETRKILKGILLKRHSEGVSFRSREKQIEAVLAMVQKEYPDATQEQLTGDILEFLKVERRDEECKFYQENDRCPWECGNCGRLWVFERRDSRHGPEYYVTYQECGKYKRWQEKKALESQSRADGAPVTAFSLKGSR